MCGRTGEARHLHQLGIVILVVVVRLVYKFACVSFQ